MAEGFEVGEDTVVARLAVEIPSGSTENLRSINQQAEQLRVNLEAVARAQSSWMDYLQQIPQLTEQAAQAQRNLITQLERTAYIQQELGGGGAGNVGVSTGTGGGAGQYSTAAPAGYQDPFQGMSSGMGQGTAGMSTGAPGMGMGPANAGQNAQYMQQMMMGNPRLAANMMAQRGMTPVTMGMGGANTVPVGGGGMGQGAPAPGSLSPQATQGVRTAAGPPDPTQGGQPGGSDPQNVPSSPHPDSPDWAKIASQAAAMGRNIVNETRSGAAGGGGVRGAVAGAAGAIMGGAGGGGGGGGGGAPPSGGGGAGGGGGGGAGGGGGGMPGGIGGVAATTGIVTGGLALMNKWIQNAGEQLQSYKNLGGIQGGGMGEGMAYEAEARIMSANPYITLEQSRQVFQGALKGGYSGKNFDTVTQFMTENLKEMNISVSDQMELVRNNVDKGKMSAEELGESLRSIKEMAKPEYGQKGRDQRVEEYKQVSGQLASQGLEGAALDTTAKAVTQFFAGDRVLKDVMAPMFMQATSSTQFLVLMATVNGVTGWNLPDAIIPTMQDQGVDVPTAFMKTIQHIASQVGTGGNQTNRITMFKQMLSTYGVNIDQAQAKALYLKATGEGGKGGENEAARAEGVARKADADTSSKAGEARTPGMGTAINKATQGDWGGFIMDLVKGAVNAAMPGQPFGGGDAGDITQGEPGSYGTPTFEATQDGVRPNGSRANASQPTAGGQTTTRGTVNGELTVRVDQDGRVTAPPTVRLSGNQIAVNSGYGGGTLNNPAPGDQSYGHGNTGLS